MGATITSTTITSRYAPGAAGPQLRKYSWICTSRVDDSIAGSSSRFMMPPVRYDQATPDKTTTSNKANRIRFMVRAFYLSTLR